MVQLSKYELAIAMRERSRRTRGELTRGDGKQDREREREREGGVEEKRREMLGREVVRAALEGRSRISSIRNRARRYAIVPR